MKKIVQVFFFLLLSGCTCMLDPMMKEKLKVYDHHMYRQYRKYKLVPLVYGGGGNGKQLHLLSLGFSTDKKLTIDTARRLLVDSISDFHQKINNSESLRPFLNEVPFPISKLEYTIEVVEEGGWWPLFPDGVDDQQHISYVILARGVVRYYIDIIQDKLPVEIHEETYEEAVAITLGEDY